LLYILASIDTKSNGLFIQNRVGKHGKIFKLYKIKSMKPNSNEISTLGRFLRKYKLDELPQFINVLLGNMSVVGPRPDVEGYYNRLQGENSIVLNLKPGITSEASIKYRNEETLLENHPNPIQYNDEVLFPDKVKMNLEYYYNQSILVDIKIIIKTIKVFFSK
jgi:lipopolysaccharide/colanic/teichoic acid biosynthesis glycosyltransferase